MVERFHGTLMSRFSPSDWLRNDRHFAQFVVTSFLCHSLHPMSHCMRTAPARSSKEMDLGILLHHVGSTFLLGPIRTLRQNFGYTSTQRLFLMSKLSVNTTLMELRFRSLQHLETTSLGGHIHELRHKSENTF